MRIIPVTPINILLLDRLGTMTFKDEQEEFPPVSKRNEYMQLHAFLSGQTLIIRYHGHHTFLILA